MAETKQRTGVTGCGCAVGESSSREPEEKPVSTPAPQPRLEDLIPIAVVIAAGCESCAQLMVSRALEQGRSLRDIHRPLGIVAYMQKLDCLAAAVGSEIVARMKYRLAAGSRTLREATTSKPSPS